MNAKLFKLENSTKIELENGIIITSEPGTTIDELKDQTILFVSEEYMDSLTIEEVNVLNYKKRSAKDLQKVRPGKKGVELELINEILASRGQLTDHGPGITGYSSAEDSTSDDFAGMPSPEGDEAPAAESKTGKGKGKGSKAPAVEAKPSKGKGKDSKDPAVEEAKPLKKQATEEEIQADMKSAKEKIGKKVSFTRSKTATREEGIISRIRLDKRSNSIQYRIKVASGDLYGKEIHSTDITFLP